MVGSRRIVPRTGPLDATVMVPGSKSITNRALVCALLADGTSTLRGVAPGDDTAAMLDCVRAFGAATEAGASGGDLGLGLGRDMVRVTGVGGELREGPLTLHAQLAGTTSRFVTAVAALGAGPYLIDGLAPLRTRPMAPLHDALAQLGAKLEPAGGWGHLPVTVSGGVTRRGRSATAPTTVALRGDVSSQFVTALMLIGPYLPGGLRIALTTPLVSRPYLDITVAVMEAFGVPFVEVRDDSVAVPPGRYGATDYAVEPDASSASYPLAAAAVCGGTVRVPGIGATSLQGDARFVAVLEQMGCAVGQGDGATEVRRSGPLRGVAVDMGPMSDLVPTLAVVAAFADTPTEITGVGFIRAKESDRIGDLVHELRACRIGATELGDGLRIEPSEPVGAPVATHHDHRLAMSLALLGLRVEGVEIDDPGVVSKSWPEYWRMLDGLG